MIRKVGWVVAGLLLLVGCSDHLSRSQAATLVIENIQTPQAVTGKFHYRNVLG